MVLLPLGTIGPLEWVIIGVVALLIFGRRLPDVARSLGRSIVEFKKGLSDVQSQIDTAGDRKQLPPAPSSTLPAPPPASSAPAARSESEAK